MMYRYMYIRIYALAVCVQGTYQCPAELLCAVTQLIEALWRGERHTAMSVMRDDVSFWPNLCLSLTRDPKIEQSGKIMILI